MFPVLFENEIKAVIELTSVHQFAEINLLLLDQLAPSIGAVLNTIEATTRTEVLLLDLTNIWRFLLILGLRL